MSGLMSGLGGYQAILAPIDERVASLRFRASERHQLVPLVQTLAFIFMILGALNTLFLVLVYPGNAQFNAVAGFAQIIAGGIAYWLITRHRRAIPPQAIAFGLGLVAVTGAGAGAAFLPDESSLMTGIVATAIIAAALFIPWTTRLHVTWVAACFAITGCLYLASSIMGDSAFLGRIEIGFFFTTGTSAVLSIAGHLITRGQRLTTFERELQVRHLHNQLRSVSLVDPICGIGSRLALEQTLARMQRATDQNCSVIMLDVDQFKLFNDHLQDHVNGDVALGQVGRALASNIRGSDQAFRFGGEEFLVLLPNTTVPEAYKTAERLRKAVEDMAIPHPGLGSGAVLTISAGVADLNSESRERILSDIKRADKALYAAKSHGRNRVFDFDSMPGPVLVGTPLTVPAALTA